MKKISALAIILLPYLSYSQSTWSIGGNALTSTGKMGSTTNQGLSFIINNVEKLGVSNTGVFKFPGLSGTGNGLMQLNSAGEVSRLGFSGTGNSILQADASGNLSRFDLSGTGSGIMQVGSTGSLSRVGLSGTGNALMMLNSTGDISRFGLGTSTQVLTGTGTWAGIGSLAGWGVPSAGITATNNKVSIGGSSPVNAFEVTGNGVFTGFVAAQQFLVSDIAQVQGRLTLSNQMFVNGYDPVAGTRNEIYTYNQPYYIQSAHLYDNNTIINHNNTGKVAIGTDAPLSKFHVVGSTIMDGSFQLPTLSGTSSGLLKVDSLGNVTRADGYTLLEAIIGSNIGCLSIPGSATAVPVWTYGPGKIYTKVECGSAVGINEENPTHNLHVNGDGYFSSQLGVNTTTVPSDFKFAVTGNSYMNGSMYIGTTCVNPDYKLGVSGKIMCTALDIKIPDGTGCWPDYVFAKGYKRKTYLEKEAYVNQHKHLEGIQSEAEIEKEGLQVVNTVIGLTKNTEENTLDIIELYKRLEALEKENIELKKQLLDRK